MLGGAEASSRASAGEESLARRAAFGWPSDERAEMAAGPGLKRAVEVTAEVALDLQFPDGNRELATFPSRLLTFRTPFITDPLSSRS